MKHSLPSYGISDRYAGDAGAEYFAWQRQGADDHGSLAASLFQPHIPSGSRVLDFGCGGGFILKSIAGIERVGVEANPEAHAQCRANGVDIYSKVADVPGTVDVVMSNHCLEHVPYPIGALKELASKLAPGGKLILIVPIDDWRAQKTYTETIDNHLYTWTPRLLGNTLIEAGFKPVSISVITHAYPPKYQILRRNLPAWAFAGLCWLMSVVARRRQIRAIATVA